MNSAKKTSEWVLNKGREKHERTSTMVRQTLGLRMAKEQNKKSKSSKMIHYDKTNSFRSAVNSPALYLTNLEHLNAHMKMIITDSYWCTYRAAE